VLFEELAHVGFAERDWDTIDASFNARAEVVRLQGILGSEFASSLSNCKALSASALADGSAI
jgi:hypothetical protein